MKPERWRQIEELYHAALERAPDERADFLAESCGADQFLRQEVESLLAYDTRAEDFISSPPDELAAEMFAAETSQSLIGQSLGHYRILSRLGRGGMGAVYLADDTRLRRQVAVKLLPASMTSNPDRVRRFQREARSVSALNHPNIITVHDFGELDGRFFIVTEYVPGRTVRELIRAADVPLNQILDLTIQAASALEAAHQAGVIHRDIKPENLMLRPDGYVKVLDFGLAKLTGQASDDDEFRTRETVGGADFETRAGVVMGTVNYMSPEQASGQKVDARSDLFSLGVVFYELLTGHRPFVGTTLNHVLVAILDQPPPLLDQFIKDAPTALQQIIDRLLAKNREQRFQTAQELLTELRALRDELPGDTQLQRRAGSEQTIVTGEYLRAATGSHQIKTGSNSWPGRLKSFRLPVVAAVILLAAAAWFFYNRSLNHPALTVKDTILLADWQNLTGDPIFDGTLKQGVAVQLAQSPYLNIFPEERARETLRLMGRSREQAQEEKITREVGREICQRRGIKALLVGTIASLGHNYVITLEMINSRSGEVIASQQTEAESREQVLKALGQAATRLRSKLGESLASIDQFNAPIEQATTASLEALQDFSVGVELQRRGQQDRAIPFFKRATERDSEFALAHLRLGVSLRDLRNLASGNKQLERAWQLRHRVSERERLSIAATWHRYITGELDRRLEATLLLTQTWPQDAGAHHIHGNSLVITGQYKQAAETYRTALQLDADYALSRANLALSLIGLNQFDEARAAIAEGQKRGAEISGFHNRLFLLAFLNGDAAEMNRQAEWYVGRPDEYQMWEWRARAAASGGRRGQADEFYAQAATLAAARGLFAEQSRILASQALVHAIFGLTNSAQQQARRALELLATKNVEPQELQPTPIMQLEWQPPAWTLALCGETAEAQALADEQRRRMPLDTLMSTLWLPLIRATIELRHGDPASAERAIQILQPARQYEAALGFRLAWVRGQAYLQAGNAPLAAAEFDRIMAHRGWDVLSSLWPLAHLGLARAAAMSGDAPKSRQHYEAFFALWPNADASLPVLVEARQQYEKLN
jgi:serine/threonine protein kinase